MIMHVGWTSWFLVLGDFFSSASAWHCIANGALFGLSIVLKERYLNVVNDNLIQFNIKQGTYPQVYYEINK